MSHPNDFKIILFDLGGVLLRLNNPIDIFGLQIGESEFKERWLQSPTVRKFESGNMDIEEFADEIVNEAKLPYDWREFIERFHKWPDRLFDGTIGLLESIPKQYSRALLSNINALHWGREEISGILSPHIDRTFLSFETGFVKPERGAFELVVRTYQCQPHEVLFFDDAPSSITAAADFGLRAVLATGIESVQDELSKRGILS